SIVRNYDVDGINLDRIRYPDGNLGTNVPSWGYNPTAIARFRAETGRTDMPANTDPQWTEWRRDQVTAIVRRSYPESTALRPTSALTQATPYDSAIPPVFADVPPVPQMSWKARPIFGHLRGIAVAADGSALAGTVVHLVETSSGLAVRNATTDGTGWFGFVDL